MKVAEASQITAAMNAQQTEHVLLLLHAGKLFKYNVYVSEQEI